MLQPADNGGFMGTLPETRFSLCAFILNACWLSIGRLDLSNKGVAHVFTEILRQPVPYRNPGELGQVRRDCHFGVRDLMDNLY